MGEADCSFAGGDAHAGLGQVLRLVRPDGEAERLGVRDDEAVSAEGGVDLQGAEARDLELRIELVGEGGKVSIVTRSALPSRQRR